MVDLNIFWASNLVLILVLALRQLVFQCFVHECSIKIGTATGHSFTPTESTNIVKPFLYDKIFFRITNKQHTNIHNEKVFMGNEVHETVRGDKFNDILNQIIHARSSR